MSKKEKMICMLLRVPPKLMRLVDEDRNKRKQKRTEFIRSCLWDKVLDTDGNKINKGVK